MISIPPRTLNAVDDSRLLRLAQTLVDSRVDLVRYILPAGAAWADGDRNGRQIHDVDLGVELLMRSGSTLRISWATPGSDEGLAIDMFDTPSPPADRTIDCLDVTNRDEWRRYVDRPIEAVAVAFYSYDGISDDRPWSIRLGFASDRNVVIALGEVIDDAVSYIPDNLVVIFDEVHAHAYRVVDSRSSSWGELVHLRRARVE